MNTEVTPLAPAARAAYGVYATFPRRRDAATELAARLDRMLAYASARARMAVWARVVPQLDSAVADVQTAATTRRGRRALTRTARQTAQAAIEAFERAYAASLPYDDHGRYHPAPGTEYPFSVSDIGRAAVQLLGPDWHAESTPWGVGACIEHEDEPGANFLLAVDEDGDLYLWANLRGESRTYLTDVSSAFGLPAVAARVADAVRGIRDAD
ncbi:hypothetical protein [Streptomyces griseocarneus]|uniref:hypothetical protein n=1 Tax=Streptomyces griseocarneus TaxID=51201 RepID=UPI00167F0FB0|nr:hypothetical protein [Streptomyces griseocarneus]MBZ6476744.1 hypothetical protein [Streptomyces griseocarneus]GHG80676.1 hypothetical protein GCM10018779_62440 [Streptomyces griseocarneus]